MSEQERKMGEYLLFKTGSLEQNQYLHADSICESALDHGRQCSVSLILSGVLVLRARIICRTS